MSFEVPWVRQEHFGKQVPGKKVELVLQQQYTFFICLYLTSLHRSVVTQDGIQICYFADFDLKGPQKLLSPVVSPHTT